MALAASLCVALSINFRAQQLPKNNPKKFTKRRRGKKTRPVIVCLGDSITHGRVGANWVDLLYNKTGRSSCIVNAGINSEHAYNMLQRCREVIDCDPDFVTILSGTNDFRCIYNPEMGRHAVRQMKLPSLPSESVYVTCLREMLRALLKGCGSSTRIAILHLPPMGEDATVRSNKVIAEANSLIDKIAAEPEFAESGRVEVLSTNRALWAALDRLPASSLRTSPGVDSYLMRMYVAVVRHYCLGHSWGTIGSSHGYGVLCDGLHLNEYGAEVLANEVADWLSPYLNLNSK